MKSHSYIWQTLLSKATYVAFVYVIIHCFGVASSVLYCLSYRNVIGMGNVSGV